MRALGYKTQSDLANAIGVSRSAVSLWLEGKVGVPRPVAMLLRMLVGLQDLGLRQPLPFAPYSGWEFFKAGDMQKGLEAAAKKWHGGQFSWGESTGETLRLALRGRDPFADEATQVAFVDLSMRIYSAVAKGELYAGTDLAALRAIAAGMDVEETE